MDKMRILVWKIIAFTVVGALLCMAVGAWLAYYYLTLD